MGNKEKLVETFEISVENIVFIVERIVPDDTYVVTPYIETDDKNIEKQIKEKIEEKMNKKYAISYSEVKPTEGSKNKEIKKAYFLSPHKE